MVLRKYQAASNKDSQVIFTNGFALLRGSTSLPPNPPPPPPCESPLLHAGEEGWSYDGCHWTYEPPPPPCDPDGTIISGPHSTEDVMYDAGCGPVQIGYAHTYIVADGNCGTREETINVCSVGDFATCNGNIYSSDAQCNVTSRPEDEPPPPCDPGYHYVEGVGCVADEDPPPEDPPPE
jgi:hypothetical protein